MKKFLYLLILLIAAAPCLGQTIKKFDTQSWFKGTAWIDSVAYHTDSIAVYKAGVATNIPIKTLKTDTLGDTLYSSQMYIDGGGSDLTFDFKVNNISGTCKILVELGVFTGMNYKWVAMADTIRQDTTFTFNLSAQSWGPYQVSNEYVLAFKEVGKQQTRFGLEARSFQW